MQIPFYDDVGSVQISRKVSLATIGVCVFVRLLRSPHFLILIKRRRKNVKKPITTTLILVICLVCALTLISCNKPDEDLKQTDPPTEDLKQTDPPTESTENTNQPIEECKHETVNKNGICSVCKSIIFTKGLKFELIADNNEYAVIGYEGTTNDIIVPNEYNGLPVTSISDFAFAGSDYIVSISLPNTIKFIGSGAFLDCMEIKAITLPDGITTIQDNTFQNCINLESITLPNTVTTIGEWAFGYCENLVDINLPENIISIGEYSFFYCTNLTNIILPNSIKNIGDYAFSCCYNLTSVTTPEKYPKIESYTFYDCPKLVEVINKSSKKIKAGSEDFGYLAYYAKTVHNHESEIKLQNDYMFYTYESTNYLLGCIGNPTNLILPNDYNGCNYSIYDYAFCGKDDVKNLSIPASVTKIGNYAFLDFNGALETINVDKSNNAYQSIQNCLIDKVAKTIILGCQNSTIPTDNSITNIGDYAFQYCPNLGNITIPDNIIEIGYGAFMYADLTNVIIGNNVTTIGGSAFWNCMNLTSITIGSGVKSIGPHAFNACDLLENISVDSNNNTYTSIGNCIIETATKTIIFGLKSSSIPTDGSAIKIGDYAFHGCSDLESIIIPDCIISIGNEAFSYCTELTNVTIGSEVTIIGEFAFYRCTELTIITIDSGVSIIDQWSFNSCSNLKDIYYNGTKAEWSKITKRYLWNEDTGEYTVHCTDGDLTKAES